MRCHLKKRVVLCMGIESAASDPLLFLDLIWIQMDPAASAPQLLLLMSERPGRETLWLYDCAENLWAWTDCTPNGPDSIQRSWNAAAFLLMYGCSVNCYSLRCIFQPAFKLLWSCYLALLHLDFPSSVFLSSSEIWNYLFVPEVCLCTWAQQAQISKVQRCESVNCDISSVIFILITFFCSMWYSRPTF